MKFEQLVPSWTDLLTQYRHGHDVAAVPLTMKLEQLVPNWHPFALSKNKLERIAMDTDQYFLLEARFYVKN